MSRGLNLLKVNLHRLNKFLLEHNVPWTYGVSGGCVIKNSYR